MEKSKVIHLEKANTLSSFLTKEERENIVSLKITGFMGQHDFDDVLDDMCDSCGEYDENDDYTPDYELSSALRHLDMGEATYVDGDCLPYFGFHTLLETAILPKGIKSTQEEYETALSESENLQTLGLPAGLKTVAGFNSCPKLTGLVLPEGLEIIEEFAFCGCDSITAIRIPASVKSISGSSFAGCNIAAYEMDEKNPYYTVIDGVIYSKDLKTLVAFPSAYPQKLFVVPETTQIIGDSAFMDSKIDSVVLPLGLTTIEGWAFQGSSIKSIDLPDTITSLGELSFRFCTELEHVRLSNGLTEIPRQTFSSCTKLKKLVIPSNVKTIHFLALVWAYGLGIVVMQSAVPPEIVGKTIVGGSNYGNITFYVPNGSLSSYKNSPGWKCFKVKEIKE